jgi:hypothetical protein
MWELNIDKLSECLHDALSLFVDNIQEIQSRSLIFKPMSLLKLEEKEEEEEEEVNRSINACENVPQSDNNISPGDNDGGGDGSGGGCIEEVAREDKPKNLEKSLSGNVSSDVKVNSSEDISMIGSNVDMERLTQTVVDYKESGGAASTTATEEEGKSTEVKVEEEEEEEEEEEYDDDVEPSVAETEKEKKKDPFTKLMESLLEDQHLDYYKQQARLSFATGKDLEAIQSCMERFKGAVEGLIGSLLDNFTETSELDRFEEIMESNRLTSPAYDEINLITNQRRRRHLFRTNHHHHHHHHQNNNKEEGQQQQQPHCQDLVHEIFNKGDKFNFPEFLKNDRKIFSFNVTGLSDTLKSLDDNEHQQPYSSSSLSTTPLTLQQHHQFKSQEQQQVDNNDDNNGGSLVKEKGIEVEEEEAVELVEWASMNNFSKNNSVIKDIRSLKLTSSSSLLKQPYHIMKEEDDLNILDDRKGDMKLKMVAILDVCLKRISDIYDSEFVVCYSQVSKWHLANTFRIKELSLQQQEQEQDEEERQPQQVETVNLLINENQHSLTMELNPQKVNEKSENNTDIKPTAGEEEAIINGRVEDNDAQERLVVESEVNEVVEVDNKVYNTEDLTSISASADQGVSSEDGINATERIYLLNKFNHSYVFFKPDCKQRLDQILQCSISNKMVVSEEESKYRERAAELMRWLLGGDDWESTLRVTVSMIDFIYYHGSINADVDEPSCSSHHTDTSSSLGDLLTLSSWDRGVNVGKLLHLLRPRSQGGVGVTTAGQEEDNKGDHHCIDDSARWRVSYRDLCSVDGYMLSSLKFQAKSMARLHMSKIENVSETIPLAVTVESMNGDSVVGGDVNISEGVVTSEMASDAVVKGEVTGDEVVTGEMTGDVLTSEVASDKVLASDEVVTSEVASDEVVTSEVASDEVVTREVASDEVVRGEVASDEVVTSEVTSDEVVTGEVTSDEVVTSEVTSDEVVTSEMASDEVVTSEVASDEVVTSEVTGDRVVTSEVTGDEVVTSEVTGDEVVTSEVASDRVVTSEVTGDEVVTCAVASDKVTSEVASDEVVTSEVASDKVVASDEVITSEVTSDEVVTSEMASDEVVTREVASDKVVRGGLASDEVVTREVASDKVVRGALASDGVVMSEVASDEVIPSEVASDEVITSEVASDEVIISEVASDEAITSEVTGDEVVTGEVTSDEVITDQVASDEVITSEVTGDEVVTGEMASDEVVTSELTSDEVITGEMAGDEVVPVDSLRSICSLEEALPPLHMILAYVCSGVDSSVVNVKEEGVSSPPILPPRIIDALAAYRDILEGRPTSFA